MRIALSLLLLPMLAGSANAAGRPMTVDDLLAVKSVSDPQISPDGRQVAYVVGELDRATGKTNTDLWLVPIVDESMRRAERFQPRRLTTHPGADNHPRWSPDGRQIAFVSDRSGSSQVWLLSLDGGEARQLTKLPIDVAGPIWSPKGDRLAFAAEVDPGKTPKETADKDKEKADSKSKARVFDHLMIRHWSAWDEGKRSHLFVCDAKTGEAKDLTPKLEVNTPPAPFGGSSDYAFSPDGKELAFTAEPSKDQAWSTNTDIWRVSVEGGYAENWTEKYGGADAQPAYSPDGRQLAFVHQERAGFESDKWSLIVRSLDGGQDDVIFDGRESIDRPIQSFTWLYSGPLNGGDRQHAGMIAAAVDNEGRESIAVFTFSRQGQGSLGETTIQRGDEGVISGLVAAPGTRHMAFLRGDARHPNEVYSADIEPAGSRPVQLSHHNDSLLADLDLARAEGFTFEGADGDLVSGWLIRPPGFTGGRKYPVVFLIHGGPQGAWHDEWHARWNYQLFASPGYAVVAINPRGSTGYGQKFTDQISKDWTGKVYEDLMKGLDYALETYPFLDRDRMAAAGGSYGGFMVNWIAGHSDRFKALISHAGVFDLTSKYGTTEELWFPEWEFGGTPWDNPSPYREQSPSNAVANFKTPTLVLHGALDYRVPDAQGIGMFTALQRRGVPSRLVFFPDEGHWIAKAPNRVVWWNEVLGWLDKYLR